MPGEAGENSYTREETNIAQNLAVICTLANVGA